MTGEGGQSLLVADWLQMSPRPELEGVEKLGAVHHMGFDDQIGDNAEPPYPSTEDIFVSHEAELTQSGDYMLVTDERGGGVLPVGASCSPGADNLLGNGGIHAYPVDKLGTDPPALPDPIGSASDEVNAYQEEVYAKNSDGERAIFRAPIQTEPQGSLCTSHVFQQIPGQNRIFMAWYSQGTQVVDFTENATARSTSSGPATSSRSTRTSGSRTCSRSRGTPTGRSPTAARRATSCSATPAVTPSTSTR